MPGSVRSGSASGDDCGRMFPDKCGLFTTFCRVSVHGRCHVLSRLNELSGVAMSCLTLSRQTSWTEMWLIQPEDSLIPLFKAIIYSRSLVRKVVSSGCVLFLIFQRRKVYVGWSLVSGSFTWKYDGRGVGKCGLNGVGEGREGVNRGIFH